MLGFDFGASKNGANYWSVIYVLLWHEKDLFACPYLTIDNNTYNKWKYWSQSEKAIQTGKNIPENETKIKKKNIQKALIRKTITQFRKEAHTLYCMLNCKEREIPVHTWRQPRRRIFIISLSKPKTKKNIRHSAHTTHHKPQPNTIFALNFFFIISNRGPNIEHIIHFFWLSLSLSLLLTPYRCLGFWLSGCYMKNRYLIKSFIFY